LPIDGFLFREHYLPEFESKKKELRHPERYEPDSRKEGVLVDFA
jgi:hypothetical protein